MRIRKIVSLFLALVIIALSLSCSVCSFAADKNQRFEMGEMKKTDGNYVPKDGGLSQSDTHHGWPLGKFVIEDFTRKAEDSTGKTVFLKNVGDKISLSFNLIQDIDALNGDSTKCIAYEKKGFDKNFDFEQDEFGRGLVIVRHTNYQGKMNQVPYTNFLSGKQIGADTHIELLEEGDYEIALDYCISDGVAPFGLDHIGNHKIVPVYSYYRIYCSFSIRNGNCMVYPFDIKTKSELTDKAFTKNGFYLDLAKSRYLNIDIKKQVLNEGKDGLVEDTRFNRPSHDGAEFTDEGIYIITVSNPSTGQQTTKTIYVGKNKVLTAYATYASTGLTIEKINEMVANGSTIDENGMISDTVLTPSTSEPDSALSDENFDETDEYNTDDSADPDFDLRTVAIVAFIILLAIIFLIISKSKKKKAKKHAEEVAKNADKHNDEYEDIYSN